MCRFALVLLPRKARVGISTSADAPIGTATLMKSRDPQEQVSLTFLSTFRGERRRHGHRQRTGEAASARSRLKWVLLMSCAQVVRNKCAGQEFGSEVGVVAGDPHGWLLRHQALVEGIRKVEKFVVMPEVAIENFLEPRVLGIEKGV